MQAVAQLGGVEGGVRAAAARDHDAGGGDARDARHAEQLPVVRSHGSRRLGSVPGLALDDAIATSRPGTCGCSAAARSRTARSRPSPTRRSTTPSLFVALDDYRRCSGTPSSAARCPTCGAASASAACNCTCCATRWGCGARSTTSAYLRQLEGELTREHEDKLIKVIERFDGRSFPSTAGLARQWVTGRYRRRESSLETVYCAEIVALTYQAMGLLPSRQPAAGMTRALLERRPDRPRRRRSPSAARVRSADRRALAQQLEQDLGRLRAETPMRRSTTKVGTALMLKPRAICSSSRTSAAKRSLASTSRTSSSGSPTSAASRTSVSWSETARPQCGGRA